MTRPASSVKNSLSSVTTWDTFATESFGSPDALVDTSTLPGASINRRFAVKTTAITVRMRLRLKASPETIRTGRRNPGSDPPGSPRAAHQIWPRSTTTIRGPRTGPGVGGGACRVGSPHRRTRGSGVQWSCDPGAWRGTRPEPRHTGDFETGRAVFPTILLNRTGLQESTRQLSYRSTTRDILAMTSISQASPSGALTPACQTPVR